MSDFHVTKACPRLIDYLCIVGNREAVIKSGQKLSSLVLKPQLLKRYPAEDFKDFPFPTNVVSFCQPEGCIVLNGKKVGKKETAFFIFTLTDKDSGLTRYGICLNFYRRFEALRLDGRPPTENYQILSGGEDNCSGGVGQRLPLAKTSSDSAFSSDPRKVHSEEESDCETLAEAPSYLSADSREKSANRNGTRGKRRTKASHNLARRRQKSGVTSQTSLTASTNRVVDASTESRPDSESVDAELVPSRLRKSGLRNRKKGKLKPLRYYSLTSLCFLSHYPFVSNFRECLNVLRLLVEGIEAEISSSRKFGVNLSQEQNEAKPLLSSWDYFIDGASGCSSSSCEGTETPTSRSRPPTSSSSSSSTGRGKPSRLALHEIKEVETWIANLLAAPVPTPGQTRVELSLLPLKQVPLNPPLIFALPDNTRFSLCDFPLHLPLELLGVNKCLQVLTLILLERKIVIQSHDYAALSFCILSLTKMIYPLEYVFPVIPLLPLSLNGAEQLLLAPTPYIIGVPSNFLSCKRNFRFPEDVWLIDLDSANIKPQSSSNNLDVPSLPEPDIKVLKNHLKQVLGGMSIQPIKNFDDLPAESLTKMAESIERLPPSTVSGGKAFYPFIFGNDVDSVDIATRVAMVRFFNSPNLLANFGDHTRTLRLLPRPIVAIQVQSLLKSRAKVSTFMKQFTSSQAVEFYAEWSLTPTNIAFHRVHNSVFDPVLIGDKPKWYAHTLKCIQYFVWSENKKFCALLRGLNNKEDLATDESGSDTDIASTSSCSSYSDLVSDFQTAEVNGDVGYREDEEQQLEQEDELEEEMEEEEEEVEPEVAKEFTGNNERLQSQQSYEDNEEIMSMTAEESRDETDFQATFERGPSQNFESQQSMTTTTTTTSARVVKPPTPIPKSFCSFDSEDDEDAYNNPFQFCSRKPSANIVTSGRNDNNDTGELDSDEGTGHEEKASDEMAMELFSSIAKLTMNAQMSVCETSPFEMSDSIYNINARANNNPFEEPPLQQQQQQQQSYEDENFYQQESFEEHDYEEQEEQQQLEEEPQQQQQQQLEGFQDQCNEQVVEDQPYQQEEEQVFHYQLPFHQQQQQQNDEEVNPETEQHLDPLEQARIKKLDFFRALGQATLDEIDPEPLAKNHFDKSTLFTSHIVNASDYNRQVSAPNVPPPSDVKTLSSNIASRQMSVPASWREDPLARKRSQSTEKGVESESITETTEIAIDVEVPTNGNGNGLGMTRSASSMSNTSNFSLTTQQIWSSISSDLSGLAAQTSNLLGGFLSGSRSSLQETCEDQSSLPSSPRRLNKSFKEKDLRATAVTKGNKLLPPNKSSLRRGISTSDQNLNRRSFKKKSGSGNAEAHLMIQDIIERVLQGEGIGWLRFNRLKKMMEEESNRTFALNYFSRTVRSRISKNGHVQDFCLERPVWKGVLRLATAVIHGLELSVTTNTTGGMASAFHLLEIAHTHYWHREIYRKPSISSLATSPFGSQETLVQQQSSTNSRNKFERSGTEDDSARDGTFTDVSCNEDESDLDWQSKDTLPSRKASTVDWHQDGCESDTQSMAGSETGSFTTNVRLLNQANNENPMEDKMLESKTAISQGNRFRHGRLQRTVSNSSISNNFEKVYLFEGLVKAVPWGNGESPTPRRGSIAISQMSSSFIWEDANFWEDLFYDTVARERELIGMDSNIKNLLDRYKTLPENEKRLLEHDEDRLLATILYNMTAFMIMMQVNKTVIRKKIQRLLGKCHIGLNYSQELNHLIDDLPYLEANDIDLKPVPSRQMCRKTFIVHSGKDASSSVAFIEVRENGLIIRSVTGAVTDRWLFEELVNMTYSPKNKVLCLWRRSEGLTEMQKYYTKKCKNLYYCIKEAMESTLVPTNSPLEHGAELGGEFPVEELHTGEGGLLRVCMEGVRLLFAQRKLFIRLDHIKKCFTQKGGIFVLEEFNPKTRQLLHRYYTSSMADQICYSILCVFSYLAVGQNKRCVTATTYNNNGNSNSNNSKSEEEQS